ncbi:hypothetical protein LCGC14_0556620 [marine sediment metagenome]|uniref:Uncharacterized protein n=1 Tax=marine sediment metagenome TaxID=412755 RepID=A0A0F9RTE7_9ZZZZ
MKGIYIFLITLVIGLFFIGMYFGWAIIDSHNICDAMNITGCRR